MRVVTVDWSEKVQSGPIEKRDTWQALTLTIMKDFECILLVLTLTKDECDYIMVPILQ